jgi:hypothetical protein
MHQLRFLLYFSQQWAEEAARGLEENRERRNRQVGMETDSGDKGQNSKKSNAKNATFDSVAD